MRSYTRTPAIARLVQKVQTDEESGCWIYTGGLSSRGYGVIWEDGRSLAAHRLSYEHHVGPIAQGLYLDHLCRNRACVNPAHLEPVTPRENLMRSPVAPAALNVAKTRCRNKHPYDEANTAVSKTTGERSCRTCNNEKARQYRQRRAAA